jgi:muramoyltetrapeptide carboxypeptidase
MELLIGFGLGIAARLIAAVVHAWFTSWRQRPLLAALRKPKLRLRMCLNTPEREIAQVIRRLFRAWTEKNRDAYLRCWATDAVRMVGIGATRQEDKLAIVRRFDASCAKYKAILVPMVVIEDIRVAPDQDTATAEVFYRFELIREADSLPTVDTAREVYSLRRHGQSWRLTTNIDYFEEITSPAALPQAFAQRLSTASSRIHPPRLKLGDTIAVISPGRWMALDEISGAAKHLRDFGFRVHVHPQNTLRARQFAGDTGERVAAVEAMFADPEIDAIMLSKAGYGTLHLLGELDYESIAKNPKIIVGYSDATAMLIALHTRCGFVTFHGPMLYDLRGGADTQTWKWFQDVLVDGKKLTLSAADMADAKVLRAGTGVGTLIGGNLTLLANLIGTPEDFNTDGCILFIEDVDEKLYSLDRLLLHLKRAGKLRRICGLIVGEMHRIADEDVPFGYSLEEIVLRHCDRGVPVICGFPFGHGRKQCVLPLGVPARLTADLTGDSSDIKFELLESAVAW